MNRFRTAQDAIIYHLVVALLLELGLEIPISHCGDFDPDYSIHNQGPHRLYQFHLVVRNDCGEDFIPRFQQMLAERTATSKLKPLFVELEEYPGFIKNCTSAYLTVSMD